MSNTVKMLKYVRSCIICGCEQIAIAHEPSNNGKRLDVLVYCPNGCQIIERSCPLNGTSEENAQKIKETISNAVAGWQKANERGQRF